MLALVVNTNLTSMNALGNLSRTQRSLSKTFQNISSGQRINNAADDAAGLAVAENLDAHGRSARVAQRNINDGISVLQTYEGAANEIGDILKRQRELAVQASSETLADTERAYAHQEFYQLQQEHERITDTTNFNGLNLTDIAEAGGTNVPKTAPGQPADHKTFAVQAGVNNTANDRIHLVLGSLSGESMHMHYMDKMGVPGPTPDDGFVDNPTTVANPSVSATGWDDAGTPGDPESLGLGSAKAAQGALHYIDFQIDYVNSARSKVGAVQNRLESALNNMETYSQNLAASESRIRDADFAFETAQMSKFQVMQQAGVAILGQANGMSQGALRLI